MYGVSGIRRKPSIAASLVLTTVWIAAEYDLPRKSLRSIFNPVAAFTPLINIRA